MTDAYLKYTPELGEVFRLVYSEIVAIRARPGLNFEQRRIAIQQTGNLPHKDRPAYVAAMVALLAREG